MAIDGPKAALEALRRAVQALREQAGNRRGLAKAGALKSAAAQCAVEIKLAPPTTNGNGAEAFGGMWWALDESGSPVMASGGDEGESAEEESSSESGGEGGYSGY